MRNNLIISAAYSPGKWKSSADRSMTMNMLAGFVNFILTTIYPHHFSQSKSLFLYVHRCLIISSMTFLFVFLPNTDVIVI